MDHGIFDVDFPFVPTEIPVTGTFWQYQWPAPLFLAALAADGKVVDQSRTGGQLAILAAVLGADVHCVGASPDIHACARGNGVSVAADVDPSAADVLLITDRPVDPQAANEIMVCLTPGAGEGRDLIVVDGDSVSVGDASEGPHLSVMPHRTTEAVAAVTRALQAYRDRSPNPWASQVVTHAVRMALAARQEADEAAARASDDVQRAFDQMSAARDELRAVRASRSWRYTAPLRGRRLITR